MKTVNVPAHSERISAARQGACVYGASCALGGYELAKKYVVPVRGGVSAAKVHLLGREISGLNFCSLNSACNRFPCA